VAMKQAAFADPCETFIFGEVEDYTVIINENASASPRETKADLKKRKGFTLFPNPAKEAVYLNLKDYLGASAIIQIYNAQGGKVTERMVAEISDELLSFDLSKYGNGLYLVSVQVGNDERMIERLVVGVGN